MASLTKTQKFAYVSSDFGVGSALKNILLLQLYEQDITDPDDLMGEEVLSDKDGHFHVQGSESELGGITVKLFIGHDCNDEKKVCLQLAFLV